MTKWKSQLSVEIHVNHITLNPAYKGLWAGFSMMTLMYIISLIPCFFLDPGL